MFRWMAIVYKSSIQSNHKGVYTAMWYWMVLLIWCDGNDAGSGATAWPSGWGNQLHQEFGGEGEDGTREEGEFAGC